MMRAPQSFGPRHLVAQMALLGALSSCSSGKSDPPQEPPQAQPAQPLIEAEVKPATPKPVDANSLPIEALAQLEGLSLQSGAVCTPTIATLRPILAQLAAAKTQLTAVRDKSAAATLLRDLGNSIAQQADALAPNTGSDELRRISLELIASIRDLSEGLTRVAEAIDADDSQATGSALRRIRNGVSNTRDSIEGFTAQCPQ